MRAHRGGGRGLVARRNRVENSVVLIVDAAPLLLEVDSDR